MKFHAFKVHNVEEIFLSNLRAYTSFSLHSYFQENGYTLDTGRYRFSMDLIWEAFSQKNIISFEDILWPPNLTPRDLFLRAYYCEPKKKHSTIYSSCGAIHKNPFRVDSVTFFLYLIQFFLLFYNTYIKIMYQLFLFILPT